MAIMFWSNDQSMIFTMALVLLNCSEWLRLLDLTICEPVTTEYAHPEVCMCN